MSQTDASQVPQTSGNDPGSVNPGKQTLKGMLICLLLGLLGGGVASLIISQTIELFPAVLPPEYAALRGTFNPEQREVVRLTQVDADYRNIPLSAGLLGLVVTACLGLASGLLRRHPSATVTGMVVGGLSGAVAGACGGFLAVLLREQLHGWNLMSELGQPDPLKVQIHTMAIQFPVWVGTAMALGITFAASFRNRPRLFGPIFAAAVAGWLISSLLYPTAASILFTSGDPDMIIPLGFGIRMFWTTITASLIGIVVGRRCDVVLRDAIQET